VPASRRLLILGGTTEAGALAERIVGRYGSAVDVVTALAGRLPATAARAGRLRVGGFGGADGLAGYLKRKSVDLVIDATHPFAARISRHAAAACEQTGIARLMLVRPPWRPRPGDAWVEADDAAAAAEVVAGVARRAFLTTGPGSLDAFAGIRNVHFLVRVFAPLAEPLPLTDAGMLVARPPFTVEREQALLLEHRIDTLVTKNSGGPTESKLTAARATGTKVVMIARPPLPEGARVETVEDALDWIARAS
jgi:precorrin-6A/cobalt-precorrin-6A reductase